MTYHGSPFSLVVDLPPLDNFSQEQQADLPQLNNPSQEQQTDLPPLDNPSQVEQADLPPQVDNPSQHKQVDIRQQSDILKKYRVPKSYAAAVNGGINIPPRHKPIKHKETETETGTHNSNLLLRLLVTFSNHIHISLQVKNLKMETSRLHHELLQQKMSTTELKRKVAAFTGRIIVNRVSIGNIYD